MCICMWVCAWNAGAYGSPKCQLSPEAGAIDGYEAPAVGEENHSRVLCKSSARPSNAEPSMQPRHTRLCTWCWGSKSSPGFAQQGLYPWNQLQAPAQFLMPQHRNSSKLKEYRLAERLCFSLLAHPCLCVTH